MFRRRWHSLIAYTTYHATHYVRFAFSYSTEMRLTRGRTIIAITGYSAGIPGRVLPV